MTRDFEFLVSNFQDAVRFRQEDDPSLPQLPADLVDPSTARLIHHPLLTMENLRDTAKDYANFDVSKIPAWNIATTYSIGDQVSFTDGFSYTSLVDSNLGNSPDASPAEWQQDDRFADWLRTIRNEGIRNFWSSLINTHKEDRATKSLLDTLALFEAPGRINDQEVKTGRLVGFEIELLNQNGISVVLDRVMTQFTGDTESFNLYLWHSSQEDPVAVIPVTHDKANSQKWTRLTADNILQYRDYDNDILGGYFYLMYYEDDIASNAINSRYYFDRPPCRGCNTYNYNAYQNWSQFVRIKNVQVASGQIPANNKLFDLNAVSYDIDSNYGLNLEISAYCEIKNYMVDQKVQFAEGIAQQIIVDLLREIANNVRQNYISEQVRDLARAALQGENLGGEGAMERLKTRIDAAVFELSDIQNSACIPCLPKKGMNYSSVSVRNTGRYSRYRR
jgi:hypothetical protein